jgi:hypothetical protein
VALQTYSHTCAPPTLTHPHPPPNPQRARTGSGSGSGDSVWPQQHAGDDLRGRSPGTRGSCDEGARGAVGRGLRAQAAAAAGGRAGRDAYWDNDDDDDDEGEGDGDEDGRPQRRGGPPAPPPPALGRGASRAAAAGVALAAAAVAASDTAFFPDVARAAHGGGGGSRGGSGSKSAATGGGGGGAFAAGLGCGGIPRPETSAWFGREEAKGWDMCMKHLRSKWPEAPQFEDQITMCRIQRRDQPRGGKGDRGGGGGAHRNDYYFRVGNQIFRCARRRLDATVKGVCCVFNVAERLERCTARPPRCKPACFPVTPLTIPPPSPLFPTTKHPPPTANHPTTNRQVHQGDARPPGGPRRPLL